MDFVSVVFLVHSRHVFHDKVLLVVYIQVFGFLIDVPLYKGHNNNYFVGGLSWEGSGYVTHMDSGEGLR